MDLNLRDDAALARRVSRPRDHRIADWRTSSPRSPAATDHARKCRICRVIKSQLETIDHGRVVAMTVIKAAAVQISPVLYSREGTVNKVVQKIIELGRQRVRFATFSE